MAYAYEETLKRDCKQPFRNRYRDEEEGLLFRADLLLSTILKIGAEEGT